MNAWSVDMAEEGRKSWCQSSLARRAVPCCLAGGCCSSLVLLPSAAFAQTTAWSADQSESQHAAGQAAAYHSGRPNTTNNDEGAIVVTGIRQSFQNSIQIKRNSASVVEAVSAEEIGKLPDVSIAELIARLPGVAAQRVGGARRSSPSAAFRLTLRRFC